METFGDVLRDSCGSQEEVLKPALFGYIQSVRDGDDRSDGWHVSQLFDYCPRQELFKRLLPRPVPAFGKGGDGLYFAFGIGKAVHYWLQNIVLGPAKILWGKWRCIRCGITVQGFYPGNECAACGLSLNSKSEPWVQVWAYREPRVKHPELRIVGQTDGILVINEKQYLWELKTMNPEFYKKLGSSPPEDFRKQLNIYMWLLGFENGIVTVIDKGHQRSVKECMREYGISLDQSIVESAKVKVVVLNKAIDEKVFLDRECADETVQRAQKCPWATECFDDNACKQIEEKARVA